MKKTMVLCLLTLFMLTGYATGKTAQVASEKPTKEKPVHCYDAKEPPYQYRGPYDPFDNDTGGVYASFMAHTELPLKDVDDLTDVDIARKLFSLYLDSYKTPDNPPYQRLAEYKFDDVTQVKDSYGQIFFYIGYSVRPCQKVFYIKPHVLNASTLWIVGCGEVRNDGWIRTMMYVRLAKREDQVRMILVGTGL